MGDSNASTRRPIRWWPAVAILVVSAGLLVWFWTRDTGSTQHKVIPTFPVLFFGVLALLLWLVLFSRLRGRLRLQIFVGVAVFFVGELLLSRLLFRLGIRQRPY